MKTFEKWTSENPLAWHPGKPWPQGQYEGIARGILPVVAKIDGLPPGLLDALVVEANLGFVGPPTHAGAAMERNVRNHVARC